MTIMNILYLNIPYFTKVRCMYRVVESRLGSIRQLSLEMASGSLKVGGLSAPLLEYSLHLRAAAAARFDLSSTSSSAATEAN